MKRIMILFFAFLSILTIFSCQRKTELKNTVSIIKEEPLLVTMTDNVEKHTIHIIPLGYVPPIYIEKVKYSIHTFYGFDCVIDEQTNPTDDILAASETRYEALKILRKYRSKNHNLILTEFDIACWTEKSPEWGIFGLGYMPGSVCVVSTYRLKKGVSREKLIERLCKVSLHELGHNLGLNHCDNNQHCLMNDARGTIKTVDNEKMWLCDGCQEQIQNKK